MAKLVMDRHAGDNKYLHRDFHVTGDNGLEYVGKKFGDNGVKEYLRRFAHRFYSPLVADIKKDGLPALERFIKKTYEAEEAAEALKTTLTEEELRVEIAWCPAVRHMRAFGHEPSHWYVEGTRTVNETIADDADLGFELFSYDEQTGAAAYRFFRRCF